MKFLIVVLSLTCGSPVLPDRAPWPDRLYLDGGGFWSKRVALEVVSRTDLASEGVPVSIPIGKGAGELDLVGVELRELRVVAASGHELLFSLRSSSGGSITEGTVPPHSRLIVPASCPPRSDPPAGRSTLYVYWGNPRAHLPPDFWNPRGSRGDRFRRDAVSVKVGTVQNLVVKEQGERNPWSGPLSWKKRCALRIRNLRRRARARFAAFSVPPLLCRGTHCRYHVTFSGEELPHAVVGRRVIFRDTTPRGVVRTYYLYLEEGAQREATGEDVRAVIRPEDNLLANGGFEEGDGRPAGWEGARALPPSVSVRLSRQGRKGSRCLRLHVPKQLRPAWRGVRQNVPVGPGATYLVCGYLRGQDLSEEVKLYVHFRTRGGKLTAASPMASVGPGVRGTFPWTFLSGTVTAPPGASYLQLHLSLHGTGTLYYDDIAVFEVVEPRHSEWEGRPLPGGCAVWPVNPVVKVFPHDTPRAAPENVRLFSARNEREVLQLALRSARAIRGLKLGVRAPRNESGAALGEYSVSVVGLVPVDYPTNYYRSEAPSYVRRYPRGASGCDGFSGLWPDPLLPQSALDLEAHTTRSVWIIFSIPKEAAAGTYRGAVELREGGTLLRSVPFEIVVWDFVLPEQRHLAGIYDIRFGPGRRWWGKAFDEVYPLIAKFLSERRLCADRIHPEPKLYYRNGRVVADFRAFDKAATWYFEKLKMPVAYMPRCFYSFGWGHPPRRAFGQNSYPGGYPYAEADRERLNPAFKKAYQACLGAFWNHVKEKGWAEKFVLYISDEPFWRNERIVKQMKALCRMIHEVDPRIPIYSSTWRYVPAWKGYLDVWGVGHAGHVSPERMEEIRKSGARVWFTTDGQMCLDTPLCAVERLLPHYCFTYGASAYEFWGVSWYTYNPLRFGWHSYIRQRSEPGRTFYVRYPNGDGYLLYPGKCGGYKEEVFSSVRLEQAREGLEDYEYLFLLRRLIERGKAAGLNVAGAQEALKYASSLVHIPNRGGRYSTAILPDPEAVPRVKRSLGEAIEKLRAALEKQQRGSTR